MQAFRHTNVFATLKPPHNSLAKRINQAVRLIICVQESESSKAQHVGPEFCPYEMKVLWVSRGPCFTIHQVNHCPFWHVWNVYSAHIPCIGWLNVKTEIGFGIFGFFFLFLVNQNVCGGELGCKRSKSEAVQSLMEWAVIERKSICTTPALTSIYLWFPGLFYLPRFLGIQSHLVKSSLRNDLFCCQQDDTSL